MVYFIVCAICFGLLIVAGIVKGAFCNCIRARILLFELLSTQLDPRQKKGIASLFFEMQIFFAHAGIRVPSM